ncbi:MAG: hypothetical protein CVT88_02700 [Candidatus Altiarchaeales archaeon HGW-Altiarchaeales-1]|nr:MAG: hypothetical protein CVT88_02700 [Candidatus Altiarchaeales archaeon HGW-Altiarchaeales-1]
MLSFLEIFIPIIVIVDSPGLVPVYLAMTEKYSEKRRKEVVNLAVIVASGTLLAFAIFGNYIFKFLGVSINALEISGGILLFLIAVEMLFGRKSKTTHSEEQEKESLEKENVAIFPLAIPLLTGPGAITTVMMLITTKFILNNSAILLKHLGITGLQVLTRIMGIVVAAIAVEFVIKGVETIM